MNARAIVRETAITILADGAEGFNAYMQSLTVGTGVTPFTIDFLSGPASRNFLRSYIDPADVNGSELLDFPAIAVYIGKQLETRKVKSQKFSGMVQLRIDAYVMYRALTDRQTGDNSIGRTEARETELTADVVCEALTECLYKGRGVFQGAGVTPLGIQIEPAPVEPLADGYLQRISLIQECEVHV